MCNNLADSRTFHQTLLQVMGLGIDVSVMGFGIRGFSFIEEKKGYFRSVLPKDLWKVCNQYVNVVDAFIPNRRSKSDEELHDENAGMHNPATREGESDVEEVCETIFENEQYQAHKKDDLNVGQNDICSEDPFNIYDLLNKKQDNIIGGSSSDNMKYAP
nr:RNA-directed DNA polymerase, eukaryota, reverse transcriptase zinc-binding domain protein [Tanacetum cinerariifolium]